MQNTEKIFWRCEALVDLKAGIQFKIYSDIFLEISLLFDPEVPSAKFQAFFFFPFEYWFFSKNLLIVLFHLLFLKIYLNISHEDPDP